MALLGPFSGDPQNPTSYLFGSHWKGQKGYRVVQGFSAYNHFFGGNTWELPVCRQCGERNHQILTLDLNDPKLKDIGFNAAKELPLVSCLNCSSTWEQQLFELNVQDKVINSLNKLDTQNWALENETRIQSPLPKRSVKLVLMDEEDIPVSSAFYYKIFDSFGVDYFCRLLGAPLYVQSPIDRQCPKCGREMLYIATIANLNYGVENSMINEVDFFMGEMFLYFMLCKKCCLIKTECQSG